MKKNIFIFLFVLMLPFLYSPNYRAEGSGSAGTLKHIPAGRDITFVVAGNDASGNPPYRGEQSGPAIAAGLTTTEETATAAPLYPDLQTPPNAAMLGKGRVAFTWTGVSGASAYRFRIQLSKNSRFIPTIISTVSKTGSYKTRDALASGVYYWRVRAEDKGKGKKSGTWSPFWTFTIDTKAPTNTTVKKFINGGKKVTTAVMISLAISAKDNIGVTAYHVSERKKKPAASDPEWVEIVSTKAYAAKVAYTLTGKSDGKKTVYVRFKDAAGHVSQTKSGAIIAHTSKPETTITRQPANPTNSTSASFRFVSDKRGVTHQCSLDNGEYSACAYKTMSYENLSEGTHTFNVKAIDGVGNAEQTPASYTWTIDISPPDTAITTQPTLTANSTSAVFGFSSTKTASTFSCKLDEGPYGECVSTLTYTALAEGPHTFFVRATDGAGNSDPTPASYTWTVALFQTTITSQPPNPSNSATATFNFQTKKKGATFQCKLDSDAYSECFSPMVYAGLTEDNHTFTVMAVYDAGKEEATPAQYSWAVNLPPVVKTRGRFINKGSGYVTDKNTITLSLAAASAKGVSGYYVSERPGKPDPSNAGWVQLKTPEKEFSRDVACTFSRSMGKKTVYVWFKDVNDNVSEAVCDSIYLYNSNYVLILFVLLQIVVIL